MLVKNVLWKEGNINSSTREAILLYLFAYDCCFMLISSLAPWQQENCNKKFGNLVQTAWLEHHFICRHYNMNRIRLVWSRIWNVLSDFFVSVGLSENLSVAIFVMDSLRQLAMKFLEREELANYNFQNEFLRPFVIVMQKSSSTEIRELIVRCISQMVLSRVSNVKSGWKSVFMVGQCFLFISWL